MTDEKNMTAGSPYAPWDLRRLPNFDFSEYLRAVEKPDGKGQTAEMTLEWTKGGSGWPARTAGWC